MKSIIKTLSTKFSLKDLGRLHYFLRIEIDYSTKVFFFFFVAGQIYRESFSQSKNGRLHDNCNPLTVKVIPSHDDNELVNPTKYRAFLGSLQYLTFIQPDITHAINHVY